MVWGYRACSLDGNIESEVVFEPLDLSMQDLENFFGDAPSKKVLKAVTGNFLTLDKFRAKLIVTDLGVVVLSRFEDAENRRIVVFVKVLGKTAMAYEMRENAGFKVYFMREDGIVDVDFDLGAYECGKRYGICWAAPLYILLPKLYPEVCESFACGDDGVI